jgi:hypothetical protein
MVIFSILSEIHKIVYYRRLISGKNTIRYFQQKVGDSVQVVFKKRCYFISHKTVGGAEKLFTAPPKKSVWQKIKRSLCGRLVFYFLFLLAVRRSE